MKGRKRFFLVHVDHREAELVYYAADHVDHVNHIHVFPTVEDFLNVLEQHAKEHEEVHDRVEELSHC